MVDIQICGFANQLNLPKLVPKTNNNDFTVY